MSPRPRHRWPALVAGLPLLVAGPLEAQGEGELFATPSRSFRTGDQILSQAYRPYGLAVADLGGDGVPDVALAHYGNFIQPKVSVQPGTGDGRLGDPAIYPAAGETMDVVAADLDGDGDLDLAFCESSEGSTGEGVLVYLNQGDGTFGAERRFVVGKGPTSIVAADLDGDGDVDLATPSWYWGEEDVTVLSNDGSAHFTRADYPLPVGEQPRYLAAADVSGDGFPELLVTLRSGSPGLLVLPNDGTGAFGAPVAAAPASGSSAVGVAAADLDLDGDLDVLLGGNQSGGTSVQVLRNLGGTLAAPSALFTHISFGAVYDFAVADVTMDGWPDVLGVAQSSKYGWVLVPSTGGGGFGPARVFRTGEDARAIGTGDMDGDGDLDVLVANSGSLTITVHENQAGSFSMPPQVAVGPFCSESDAADVDHDGDLDLVTTDSSVYLLRNRGDGTFERESFAPLIGAIGRPRLRDVSGDGNADLLTISSTAFHVMLGNGDGTFGDPTNTFFGANQLGDFDTLDWDLDGDLDVALTERLGLSDGTKFYLLENRGNGTFFPPVRIKDFTVVQARVVRGGDVNTDGFPDLVGGHGETVVSWLGRGDGTFQAPIISSLGQGGTVYMVLEDLDGDGLLDVAGTTWGSTFRGENLAVAYGYGDGEFTPPFLAYGMFSLSLGGLGGLDVLDADGDGDLDLAGGAYAADDVCVFLNRGDRTFATEVRFGVDGVVEGVLAADLDGDGLEDLAVNVGTEPPIGGAVALLLSNGANPSFEDLGLALAGTNGLPELVGLGTIAPGAAFELRLSRALGGTSAFHVIGELRIDRPLLGGVLAPLPSFVIPATTGANGTATLGLGWPLALPAGTSFYAQTWTIDPAGPQGVAASNALRATQL